MWWLWLYGVVLLLGTSNATCIQYPVTRDYHYQQRSAMVTSITVPAGTMVTISHSNSRGAVTVAVAQQPSYRLRIGAMHHNITQHSAIQWSCDYYPCAAMVAYTTT